MKKRNLILAIMAFTLTVFTVDSLKKAFIFDTRIAYADPQITYVYGTDGSEHLALNNFYPKTNQLDNPSNWNAGAGGGYQNVQANLNMSHEALNACRIIETYCDNDRNNLCPLAMTGVAVVTPSGQVIQLWSNPF